MEKEMVVSSDQNETRVAILESKKVVELYFDRKNKKSLVGNIYFGKVKNILPSLDAAFIDIGEDKNAFLYINEAGSNLEFDSGEEIPKKIQYVLKPNQMVLVQVTKDPMKTKGARLTTFVSIPGRFLVLAPFNDGVGVSKKLDDEERARLRGLAEEIKDKDFGIIVRTAAKGVNKGMLKNDLKLLIRKWNKIEKSTVKVNKPKLLSREHSLVMKLLRDTFSEEFNAVYVDKKAVKKDMAKYLKSIGSKFTNIIVHHGQNDIFESFNIDGAIESALEKKVWLRSGGFIVIDYNEALTSIDVNTGKYISGKNSVQTILRTNIEAAEVIANQLRLRDIGGIIVIDFIDMISEKDRERVYGRFLQCLESDKTKTEVMHFSKLGLIEMTRKNVSDGIMGTMCKTCLCCNGTGYMKSEETARLDVERKIRKLTKDNREKAFLIKLNPSVASMVIGQDGKNLKHLEFTTKRYIAITGDAELPLDGFLVVAMGTVNDIKDAAKPFKIGDILEINVEEYYMHNKEDGISRVDGFIIQIPGGGRYIGENVRVEIKSITKTSAVAEIV